MGKGVRAKWKLLLKMSAACKGGRNVHELFFPSLPRAGREKSFEQKLSFFTNYISECKCACMRQAMQVSTNCVAVNCERQLIATCHLLAASSVQVIFALLQTSWHAMNELLQVAVLLASLNLRVGG